MNTEKDINNFTVNYNNEGAKRFCDLETYCITENSIKLCELVSEIGSMITNFSDSIIINDERRILGVLDSLKELNPINAYAIEGIRGSGKTTQISMLESEGCVQSGSRLMNRIYTDIIKPNKVDMYMTMFGGEGKPVGSIIDTLLVGAFHADRLEDLQSKHFEKTLLIDRHWLSFFSLEYSKMKKSGVDSKLAFSIVTKIVSTWNGINGTIILDNLTTDECEKRIVLRGEKPRTRSEIEIDRGFCFIVETLKSSGVLVPKFSKNIEFVDANNTPINIHSQIKRIVIENEK